MFIDVYFLGKEVEVDVVVDGKDVLILIIVEYIEKVGVYLGDSYVFLLVKIVEVVYKEKMVSYV